MSIYIHLLNCLFRRGGAPLRPHTLVVFMSSHLLKFFIIYFAYGFIVRLYDTLSSMLLVAFFMEVCYPTSSKFSRFVVHFARHLFGWSSPIQKFRHLPSSFFNDFNADFLLDIIHITHMLVMLPKVNPLAFVSGGLSSLSINEYFIDWSLSRA